MYSANASSAQTLEQRPPPLCDDEPVKEQRTYGRIDLRRH
jgi:hypothetical protein